MTNMDKIRLGKTNETISCIGLGTMYFGSKTNEQTSFNILDYYTERGGNFIDSANKYASWILGCMGGESELLIGKWLRKKGTRDKMFLTSKVGFPYGKIPRSLKKEIIVSECEKSLKRMRVNYIDLYFAHAYDTKTPAEEVMEAFYFLQKQGKIRFAGASNYWGWQLAEAAIAAEKAGFEGFACLQQRHTYLDPALRTNFGTQLPLSPETEQYCVKHKLTIMAYSPLLGGAYVNAARPIPVPYQNATTDLKLKILKQVSEEINVNPNAVVLAWMMQSTPPIIPMVTGSSLRQLEENMQALSVCLNSEQMALLNQKITQPPKY